MWPVWPDYPAHPTDDMFDNSKGSRPLQRRVRAVPAHFDMEIHGDEFQPGVLADKQPAVSDVLSTWRERYKRPPGRSLGAVIMARG